MGLEHKRYVCTQGGIQTLFQGTLLSSIPDVVFLSFLNVYDISSSLLSNLHPLSILRHITVKPVSNGPLHMARRLPRMTPFIYLFSMILVDSMGSVQTSKINCIRNAIYFRRLLVLIVSKHMRKVMIRF